MQEAQRQRERERIDAGQAGAAKHHIDTIMLRIGPETAPQKLDHALRAIFGMNAGAAKLEKILARMTLKQRRDVEFALAVEAAVPRRDLAAQQPVGADDLRLLPAETITRREIDNQQMIAKFVKAADVAPHQCRGAMRHAPPSS